MNLNKKIIMGGAQFGMNYGIANKNGEISLKNLNKIDISSLIFKLFDNRIEFLLFKFLILLDLTFVKFLYTTKFCIFCFINKDESSPK